MDTDISDLVERIHALPPELFDEVKDLVFTTDIQTALIDKDNFKFPTKLMSINRTTRSLHSARYFESTNFVVECSLSALYRWLDIVEPRYLDRVHLSLVFPYHGHDTHKSGDALYMRGTEPRRSIPCRRIFGIVDRKVKAMFEERLGSAPEAVRVDYYVKDEANKKLLKVENNKLVEKTDFARLAGLWR